MLQCTVHHSCIGQKKDLSFTPSTDSRSSGGAIRIPGLGTPSRTPKAAGTLCVLQSKVIMQMQATGQLGRKPFRSMLVDASAVTKKYLFFLSCAKHGSMSTISALWSVDSIIVSDSYLQKQVFDIQAWVLTSEFVCFLQVVYAMVSLVQRIIHVHLLATCDPRPKGLRFAGYLNSQHSRVINNFRGNVQTLQFGEEYCRCYSHIF